MSQERAHIGPSICIKGEVSAREPLTVDGQIVGTIDLAGHQLTLTGAARIDADIVAHTIVVGGNVNGRLTAEGRIIVRETAHVEGEVSAPRLSVDEGARVEGRIDVAGQRAEPTPVVEPVQAAEGAASAWGGAAAGIMNHAAR
jgi:cytoskeletal protein CcmA (bactofilin family)